MGENSVYLIMCLFVFIDWIIIKAGTICSFVYKVLFFIQVNEEYILYEAAILNVKVAMTPSMNKPFHTLYRNVEFELY